MLEAYSRLVPGLAAGRQQAQVNERKYREGPGLVERRTGCGGAQSEWGERESGRGRCASPGGGRPGSCVVQWSPHSVEEGGQVVAEGRACWGCASGLMAGEVGTHQEGLS